MTAHDAMRSDDLAEENASLRAEVERIGGELIACREIMANLCLALGCENAEALGQYIREVVEECDKGREVQKLLREVLAQASGEIARWKARNEEKFAMLDHMRYEIEHTTLPHVRHIFRSLDEAQLILREIQLKLYSMPINTCPGDAPVHLESPEGFVFLCDLDMLRRLHVSIYRPMGGTCNGVVVKPTYKGPEKALEDLWTMRVNRAGLPPVLNNVARAKGKELAVKFESPTIVAVRYEDCDFYEGCKLVDCRACEKLPVCRACKGEAQNIFGEDCPACGGEGRVWPSVKALDGSLYSKAK